MKDFMRLLQNFFPLAQCFSRFFTLQNLSWSSGAEKLERLWSLGKTTIIIAVSFYLVRYFVFFLMDLDVSDHKAKFKVAWSTIVHLK